MVTALTMRASVQFPDSFSPYLDPEPIADFFDDIGQRAGTAFALAIVVHIGLFMMLHLQFTPPILPDEPDPIEIQIISFEPEAEPVPEVELRPTIPAPAQAPVPKPKPKPVPIVEPIPELIIEPVIEPEPIIEPLPEPEPVLLPPTPEILISETVEPEPEIVIEPLPVPEPILEPLPIPEKIPETVPEPIPEPIVEIFEPIPDPLPEAVIEPLSEPIIEIFEPIPEPLPEPEPIIEPLPEVIEDLPIAPIIADVPVSGAVTREPILEPILDIPPPVQEIIPEPIIETLPVAEPAPILEPEPEIIEPEKPVIITPAPTILASPDAPITKAEEQIAVPSAGPTPLETILQNADPNRGGGNQTQIPIGAPPSGGTRLSNPGAKGWTLAPNSYGGKPGKGYKGMILDIKCREEGRTHEDCPDYIPKYQGRDASGYEGFGVHTPRGTSTTKNEGNRSMNMGSSIFKGGTYGGPSVAMGGRKVGGNTDDNTGNPSTSVLDDVYLPNYDLSIPIPSGGSEGGRVRDIFNAPSPAPWTLKPSLPVPDEEDDDELKLLILKPKQETGG